MTAAANRFTHFIEARLRPGMSVPGGMFAVASEIAGAVHRANVKLPEGERYALTFPDLEAEDLHPAGRIRVYGRSEEAFDHLVEDPAIAGLMQMRVMGRVIREAPADEPIPLCIRCRAAEKATSGWAERQHRRMQRMVLQRRIAGEELQKLPIPLAERLVRIEQRDEVVPARLHFRLRSASTGQRFSIFVRRAAPNDTASLDAYGLVRIQP